ncbi:MAG TPA: amidohydrolase, partial [Actinomycetota bacterium]
ILTDIALACDATRAVRTLYRAARVRTQSYPETGEWLLIDDRHVQRVGSDEPPEADRVVDLPGATIVPGFIDTHVHLTATGLSLANTDVESARSARDLLAAARTRTASTPGDGPVYLQGYDETRWDDPRLPTTEDLDAVTERALLIRRTDGHVALANTVAIQRAIERSDTPVPIGVERGQDGSPTGVLTGDANNAVGRWALSTLSDHELQGLQLKAAGLAAARGITAVHEMAMPHWHGETDLRVLLQHRSRLPIDATPIVATTDLSVAIRYELTAVGGDLPTDGSIGARTAAVHAPYLDTDDAGATAYPDDELAEFFHGGHAAGLQVGVHAIGDRAIEQVLGTWERVYQALDSRERRHFRARRHRVEHFEMPSYAQIERTAVLGLAVSVQPAFDRSWGGEGGLYEQRLGADRAATMNPFRTLLERGVEVGVGSDAPVTALDPMLCLVSLESHHHPAQRVTRTEAIRLHTIGSARVGHQEEKKGSLSPGMHADFVAFDDDPFTAISIEGLRPVLTVSLGREVFAA